jgi:hypothetical protein
VWPGNEDFGLKFFRVHVPSRRQAGAAVAAASAPVFHGIAFVVSPFTAARGGCHTCAIKKLLCKMKTNWFVLQKTKKKKLMFFFRGKQQGHARGGQK